MAKKKVVVKEPAEETPANQVKEEQKAEDKPSAPAKEEQKAEEKSKEAEVVEKAFAKEGELGDEELTQVEKDIRADQEKEFEEEIETERKYTINLYKEGVGTKPRQKRAKKAIIVLKQFIKRHMKAETSDSIYIHPEVNKKIWGRGIRKPPRKIKIRTTKSKEGIVRVFLD